MSPEIYAGLEMQRRVEWNKNRKYVKRGFRTPIIDEMIFDRVVKQICLFYELDRDRLIHNKSRDRKTKDYPLYRQLTHYLIKKYHDELDVYTTLTVMGKRFDKHHATILHSIKTIKGFMQTDSKFRKEVLSLQNKIETILN